MFNAIAIAIPVLSYLILSYPILSYPILSYPILSYPMLLLLLLLSCPVLSYAILSYLILSYPILSYPILSYPILSYPILSYPILSDPGIKWLSSNWLDTNRIFLYLNFYSICKRQYIILKKSNSERFMKLHAENTKSNWLQNKLLTSVALSSQKLLQNKSAKQDRNGSAQKLQVS